MSTTTKYIFFAVLATLLNLGTQAVLFAIYNGAGAIYVAMFFGTLAGLLLKYILDKHFIFNFQTNSMSEDARKFTLYSFMGIFTTLLFWSVELSFDLLLAHPYAKYIGGALGLALGYLLKYQLDKRFVFTNNNF